MATNDEKKQQKKKQTKKKKKKKKKKNQQWKCANAQYDLILNILLISETTLSLDTIIMQNGNFSLVLAHLFIPLLLGW